MELARFRVAFAERLSAGGLVKIGFVELGELKKQVGDVEDRLDGLNERVSRAFLLSMSAPMFGNLQKPASGRFGHYDMSGGLEREIRHLRDIGYVAVPAVAQIPRSGDDLSRHVTVTEAGATFIALRNEIAGSP